MPAGRWVVRVSGSVWRRESAKAVEENDDKEREIAKDDSDWIDPRCLVRCCYECLRQQSVSELLSEVFDPRDATRPVSDAV